MQHVGSRSEPSIIRLLVVVVIVLVIAFYLILAIGTGDFLWWNPKFSETPNAILVHCNGHTTDIDPGSFHFSALARLVNENLSGRKRWDPLSLSEATYEDYRTDPKMIALEVFYPEPVRIHSNYKFFSNVDNLIIPLEGRHANTNAVFGLNQGRPAAGSLHVESTAVISTYLSNQEICSVAITQK